METKVCSLCDDPKPVEEFALRTGQNGRRDSYCGEMNPIVLEFDHRDPKEKELTVSALLRRNSLKRVQEEVAKCDVRCGNCHTKRTAIQYHWYWIEFLKTHA